MSSPIRRAAVAALLVSSSAVPLQARDIAISVEELAALRAQLKQMDARIDELDTQLAQIEYRPGEQEAPALDTPEPAEPERTDSIVFEGAPEINAPGGWSFKPRGRLMYDAGFTDVPDSTGREEGFGNEVRRARLGVSGSMPGGFGYKLEFDFAGNAVDVTDAILTYETGDLEATVGQHNNFQSLEELTSSLHTTFIERAAFTDAFGFQRRIGASLAYENETVLVQGGVFTDNFEETSSKNVGFSARGIAMPTIGKAQAHLGASVHFNDLGTPGDTVRYRQRPLVHFTSERFVDTGSIAAESEFGYGLEAALISGAFHAAAEGAWLRVDRPGSLANPTFFGGYLEAGLFLTRADSRGYGSGKFDRVKPEKPVGKGGFGSVQFNLRYDYLNLNDAGIVGGIQNGYFASLIWKPTDYTLISANYGKLEYDDAVYAEAGGETSYTVDAFGVRAQVDF